VPKFKSEQINVRVSNKLKQQIEKLAKEQEMTIAEFIRFLVLRYTNELENANNKEQS
jgi:predicted DNA-binding protein